MNKEFNTMHDNEYLKLEDIFTDLRKLHNAPSTTIYSLMNISKSISKPANESTMKFKSNQMDEDIKRAKSLVALAELREKFKQTGDTGLAIAKQRVNTVFAKYAEAHVEK